MKVLKKYYQIDQRLNYKKNMDFGLLVVLFVVVAPKLLLAWRMVPYGSFDEAGSMAFGAFLAGKDWRNVFAGQSYYGFFMSFLYAPVFYFFDNPYTIYRVICSLLAILQAIPAIITYKIVKESVEDDVYRIYAVTLSIISSYFIVVGIQVYNETGIIVLIWLLTLGIYEKYAKDNDKYIFLFLILAGFSNAIHERAIIILIAIVITAIVSVIILDIRLLSVKSAVALVLSVSISRMLTKFVQKLFWAGDGAQHNASVLDATSSVTKLDFFDSSTRRTFEAFFCGLINTYNMILAGAFILIIFVVIDFWVKVARNKAPNRQGVSVENFLFICSLCFGLCFAGMNVGLFASWGSWISGAIKAGEINAYQYKAFTNTRYSIPFLMPILLCSEILLIRNNVSRKLLCLTACIGLIVHLYWVKKILPLIPNTGHAFFVNFFPLTLRKTTESLNMDVWLRASVCFLISIWIFTILLTLRKKRLFFWLLSIFLIYQFYYTAFVDHIYSSSVNSKKAAAVYDLLVNQYGDESHFPNHIYSFGGDNNRVQFYLNTIYIEKDSLPDSNEENVIVVWGGDLNTMYKVEGLREALKKFHYIKLFKDEYVFVKGSFFYDFASSDLEMGVFN